MQETRLREREKKMVSLLACCYCYCSNSDCCSLLWLVLRLPHVYTFVLLLSWALWVHRNLSVFNHLYFHLSLACVHTVYICIPSFSFFFLHLSFIGGRRFVFKGLEYISEYWTSLTLIFHLFCSKNKKKLHFCLLVHWIEQRNNRIQKFSILPLSPSLQWNTSCSQIDTTILNI